VRFQNPAAGVNSQKFLPAVCRNLSRYTIAYRIDFSCSPKILPLQDLNQHTGVLKCKIPNIQSFFALLFAASLRVITSFWLENP
jgi:hypothetical protein